MRRLKFTGSLVRDYLESIYEEALCIELKQRGMFYERQVGVDVFYKGNVIKGQRIDLLVEKQVIVENKSIAKLPDVAKTQVLSYLKATSLKRGLLLNFGLPRLVDGVIHKSFFIKSLSPL